MTVKALCEKYSLKFQTVYKKITHHKDNELAGHITKVKGESLELDDFAIDFLLPTHVKVMQAIEECEGIVRENDELKEKLDSTEAIVEQKDKQISKANVENKDLLEEIACFKSCLSERNKENSKLKDQLESERSNSEQKICELEKRIAELFNENKILTEKLEAVPKIFRKNQ